MTEFRLILERDGRSILEDTINVKDCSVMYTPNADEFETKIRNYIRGLNPQIFRSCMPDIAEVIKRARALDLSGMDQEESVSDDGWWETSTGAEFGRKKKEEIEKVIEDLIRALS